MPIAEENKGEYCPIKGLREREGMGHSQIIFQHIVKCVVFHRNAIGRK